MDIRELKKEDKEKIEYIVVKTARGAYKDKPEATKLLFCDYYVDNGTGYVLVNNNEVVGYILCSTNYKKYINIFKKDYMPKLKQIDKKEYYNKKFELIIDRIMGKNYPSHLHVDILEEFCGGGNGSRLMATLLDRLQSEKIKGVWLGVDPTNDRAISYYKKFGFKTNCIVKPFGLYYKKL